MHPYLSYVTAQQKQIIAFIKELVECESPTDAPAEVNHFVDLLISHTGDIAVAKRIKAKRFGDHLRLEFKLPGGRKEGQILGLGHSDTVWPMGTLRHMPFRLSKGRLWGPGALDMKSGLAFFITAARTLRELDIPVNRKIALLVVSDEEVGSPTSRQVTEVEAKRSNAVLVLEPGTGLTGKLKTARKGIGHYIVSIEGRAAHAGVDFDNGASAILEAAKQIEKISALTNRERGITVNPGVVSGGTRSNVVAAEARIEVDARAVRMQDTETVDRKLKALRPVDKRCKVQVEGGLNRPPMERTKAIARLFTQAQEIGTQLGLTLEESSTGGGSDGNFTAALGVPTLDGLGGVGEGAHAANENILVDCIADRVTLLVGLLSNL
ncbi:MAG: M20 family metallopeptidase [Bryobacteraceae bacterium]